MRLCCQDTIDLAVVAAMASIVEGEPDYALCAGLSDDIIDALEDHNAAGHTRPEPAEVPQ